MARRLIFDPCVPDDLANALDYYADISLGLADRFRRAVDNTLDEVAERPESFPFDIAPVRFAKVRSFPYLVFFVAKPRFVSVIAITHGSANPDIWRGRGNR